jgi:MerR family transcriptional regulator, copper efflux regulator
MTEPVACSLEAGDLASRLEQWRRALTGVASVSRREPHVGTLRFSADADVGQLAALCADEVRCCPFFVFDLRIGKDGVELTVRVPVGAEATLESLIGSYAEPS